MSDTNDKNYNVLIVVIGILSCVQYLLLLVITEYVTDASILLQYFIFPVVILFAIAPLFMIFIKNKKTSNILAFVFYVLTSLGCGILYYRRNKITYFLIPDNVTEIKPDSEQEIRIMKAIKPSGVAILISNKGSNVKISIKLSHMDLTVTKEDIKKAQTKLAKKLMVTLPPSGNRYKKEDITMEKTLSELPKYIFMKKRLSGYFWQGIMNITPIGVSGEPISEKERKEYGMKKI